ncbi:cation:proton antiporter [Leifsonia poae]|uniref:cation:proton antiporter n=1 Tax=Leifsonia poae TaxID=110933 RepID=UPI0022F2A1A5|nr:cation:proton antiporter [Leifsonia poae]
MSFSLLALIVLVGLLGPLLALRSGWRIPVIVGELVGGLLIGASGFGLVDASNNEFRLLADIGFGLTMVVVGSQIPVRDVAARAALRRGIAGAAVVGTAAAIGGIALAALFGTGHAAVYAVVIASSSAAIVLPMLQSVGVRRATVGQLMAQIAVADIACIVILPIVAAPGRAGLAALGAAVIAVAALLLFFALRRFDRSGARSRLHQYSEKRRFALELRFSLLTLFSFGAIAQFTDISIMLAGFALGLLLSATGEPHRLARQLFGMTEGFFGPLFFVWLGASLDLRSFATHPAMILLGLALGVAAVVVHTPARITGLPWVQTLASAGQLGVPVAAVTLGIQAGTLAPGEDAAIVLGALISVAVAAVAIGTIGRRAAAGKQADPM